MQANSAELFEFARLLLESAMHTFTVKEDGTIYNTATEQPVTLTVSGVSKQLALFTPQNQADKLVIIPFKDCFTADKARNWYYSAIREGLVQMVYGLLEQVIQHSVDVLLVRFPVGFRIRPVNERTQELTQAVQGLLLA